MSEDQNTTAANGAGEMQANATSAAADMDPVDPAPADPEPTPAPDQEPVKSVVDHIKQDLFASEKELLEAIAAKTGEKVTAAQMENRIAQVAYAKIGETVTVCSIMLDNGYSVRGESACVDPANFDEKIGKSLAYKQAFDKLWPLFGFLLAEVRFVRGAL